MLSRAEIQDGIDNGFVYIPPGHVKLDQPLEVKHDKPLIIQGSGPATVLEADYDVEPAIDLQVATIGKRNVHRVLRDMVITRANDKRNDPDACGLRAFDQANLTISGLVFLQHPWGIRADGGTEWRIRDCRFTHGCANGIRFHKTINVYIDGCILEHSGVGIEVNGGAHSIHLSQCQIVNGAGYDYAVIFDDGADANSICQCVMEGARYNHVYFAHKAKDSIVSDSWFGSASKRPNGIDGGNGIQVDPDSYRITLSNNRFGGQIGPAIILDRVKNVLIQGNRFEDNCADQASSQIHLAGCKFTSISNNSFEHCVGKSALLFRTAGASGDKNRNILISGNDFSLMLNTDGGVTRPATIGTESVGVMEMSGNMLDKVQWA